MPIELRDALAALFEREATEAGYALGDEAHLAYQNGTAIWHIEQLLLDPEAARARLMAALDTQSAVQTAEQYAAEFHGDDAASILERRRRAAERGESCRLINHRTRARLAGEQS